ncbi:MAG: MauE/DoxX family redox-associated membrane protein [Pseudomonadota bacterium]
MRRWPTAILKSNWTYFLIRAGVAALFLTAGFIKIQDPGTFSSVIDAFGLLPRPLPDLLAIVLPIIEILAGVLLLFDLKGGLPVITALTLMFCAVLLYGLQLGLDVDCGCYGPGDPEAEAFHDLRGALVRDLWILTAIGYLFWFRFTGGNRPVESLDSAGVAKK